MHTCLFWKINLLAIDEDPNQISEALYFGRFANKMSFLSDYRYYITSITSSVTRILRNMSFTGINEIGFIQIIVRNISPNRINDNPVSQKDDLIDRNFIWWKHDSLIS